MNHNSSQWKMFFIWFHFANVKGNWTDLAKKNLQPGANINAIFRLSLKKCLNRIIIRTFPKHLICFEHQNHVILFEVLF